MECLRRKRARLSRKEVRRFLKLRPMHYKCRSTFDAYLGKVGHWRCRYARVFVAVKEGGYHSVAIALGMGKTHRFQLERGLEPNENVCYDILN